MKQLSFVNTATLILFGLITGGPSLVSAATFNVPTTQYPHIQDAILAAAASGDEIRVSNTYNEIESANDVIGKSVTIRSYTPDFSTPAPGAQWNSLASAGINGYLLSIANGAVTIEGFRDLRGQDCNVFFLNSDAELNIIDCQLTGTGTADTAAIKSGAGATNLSIDIEGTSFTDNGRGIWLPQISGDTSLVIRNSAFTNNASYPLNWETLAGNHVVHISDTYCDTRSIRMMRFFGFRAPAGALTTNDITFERCHFYTLANNGRYPLSIAGILNTSDPASTMTVAVRNCLFDLTEGTDNAETVAINSQDDTSLRKCEITMEHCTVVFNGTLKCGIRLRENASTLHVKNSIFEAGGEGHVAFRSLRGKTISYKNLLNARAVSETFAGGSVELSGNEIVGQGADFVDGPGRNYRLNSDSAALAAGDDLGILDDLVGNPRPSPVGTNPDLGAYESVVTASVNDWSVY